MAETLKTLEAAGSRVAGAGRNRAEASSPAILGIAGKGRILVYGFGAMSSGIPRHWRATDEEAGVNLLPDLSARTLAGISDQVRAVKGPNDIVVASIHWGPNWGYEVSREERRFAHGLIDDAAVDVVHGHSSHHAKPLEVYRGKSILYGCGDFLNDYEGIGGHDAYRGDLVLLYFVTFALPDRALTRLQAVPFRIRRLRLERASGEEAAWLCDTLDREGRWSGTRVRLERDNVLSFRWFDGGTRFPRESPSGAGEPGGPAD